MTDFAVNLVRALDATWRKIRELHPDVPAVIITVGPGSIGQRAGEVKLGHFASARWHVGESLMAELFVGGEELKRGPAALLETLLHEAAHGLAETRKVADVSRGGRYHNKHFRALAREMGLVADMAARGLGYSDTKLGPGSAATYAGELAGLGQALTAHRKYESPRVRAPRQPREPRETSPGGQDEGEPEEGQENRGRGRASNNNGITACCGCEPPRRVRMAPSPFELGPVTCGVCDEDFTASI